MARRTKIMRGGKVTKKAKAEGFGRSNRISQSAMARGGGLHDPS